MVGTADSVLIREVSLIQSVLYREFPLCFTHELPYHLQCYSSSGQTLNSEYKGPLLRVMHGQLLQQADSGVGDLARLRVREVV